MIHKLFLPCLQGDKGGPSTKLAVQLANCKKPCSIDNLSPIAFFEAADTYDNMVDIFDIYLDDMITLQNNYKIRDRLCRLFLVGDYEFLTKTMGHMGAASKFPCMWCHITNSAIKKPNSKPHGPMKKVKGRWVNNEDWYESRTAFSVYLDHLRRSRDPRNGDKSSAGKMSERYHSLVHPQILPITQTNEHLLHIVPPSLHIILGLVHRFYLKIESAATDLGHLTELTHVLENELGVVKQMYHSMCFNGNHCMTIVNNYKKLLNPIAGHPQCKKLIQLFEYLKNIFNKFTAAFLTELEIRELSEDCWELGRWFPAAFPQDTIPPKLHILICHIPEFAQQFKTVGIMSEQTIETLHKVMNQVDRTYNSIKNKETRARLSFGQQQQRVVCDKEGTEKRRRICHSCNNAFYKTERGITTCQDCHFQYPDVE